MFCAKDRFSIKTQFYDLVRFISIEFYVCTKFGANWFIQSNKEHEIPFFSLKMAKYPCLNSPESVSDLLNNTDSEGAIHNLEASSKNLVGILPGRLF